jgi:hypothetical protein
MPRPAEFFDAVLALVADGMAVRRAVKQIGVHYGQLKAYADADPERTARWQAAARDRKLGYFESGFDEAVRRVEAGEFLDAVRAAVYGDRLTKSGFNKYLKCDPVRGARWKAASKSRDRKHPSAGVSAKYSAADFEVMLLTLECSGDQPANASQKQLELIVYVIEPWLCALESAFNRALLTEGERKTMRFRFDRDDLTRASLVERATAINSLIASETINPNEGRAWLGLAPYGGGDKYGNRNITVKPSENPRLPGEGTNDE